MTFAEVADIVREAIADLHVFLPANIAWMGVCDAHFPFLARNCTGRLPGLRLPPLRRRAPAPINISAGIGRVLEDRAYTGITGFTPQRLMRGGSSQRPNRQRQFGLAQITHDRLRTSKTGKPFEHETDPRLHLGIGIE